MQHWFDNASFNQQWTFEFVSSSTSLTAATATPAADAASSSEVTDEAQVLLNPATASLTVNLPKGVSGQKRVMVSDKNGLVWAEGGFDAATHTLSTAGIPAGAYTLRVQADSGVIVERRILIKK
jgi:hypothetical protein